MALQPGILAQMSEQDEAGKVVRTYVLSSSSALNTRQAAGKYDGEKRVDIIVRIFLYFIYLFIYLFGFVFSEGGRSANSASFG